MIDFYGWNTPNGQKISIMLEEINLPYKIHLVDITKGEQFNPDFLKISPNNKIPAIIDHDCIDGNPISIFESGSILIYLAEKTGKFLSTDLRQRTETISWLMFQMAGFGPMLGQAHHFRQFAPEKIPYAIERYSNEAKRLYGVLDKRLSEVEFLAPHYSIADIAAFPWAAEQFREWQGIDIKDYPNVKRWFETIAARPAVQKGLQALKVS